LGFFSPEVLQFLYVILKSIIDFKLVFV
jgi:hypothetical protein